MPRAPSRISARLASASGVGACEPSAAKTAFCMRPLGSATRSGASGARTRVASASISASTSKVAPTAGREGPKRPTSSS